MIEIGGKPILWHIMKIYSAAGVTDFVVCLGYKGYVIKEYFANYFLHMSNVTFDMTKNEMSVLEHKAEPWKVTLIDTGEHSMTGGRLRRVRRFLGDEDFCFTYGDGLSDIDMREHIAAHRASKRLATVTAVQPPGRYGAITLHEDGSAGFKEKPRGDGGWVNGGFFVLSPKVIDYVDGDDTVFEAGPMERLAADGQLNACQHRGFWHAMDTLRDKLHLEQLWSSGNAPWCIWDPSSKRIPA
jgi:glucose-1-phosphate cytidylyltransferase